MTRSLVLAMALLAFAGAAAPQKDAASPGRPADLWLDAVVIGRGGAPVMDLDASEFEVWISGYRIPLLVLQRITPADRGRTLMLLLDDSATPAQGLPRIREAARAFVDLMQEGDRIGLASLHEDLVQPTGDREVLLRALDRFRVRGFPFRMDEAGALVVSRLAGISRRLADGAAGRKVVVGIGAGPLFDTPLQPQAPRDGRAEWVEAMRAAGSAHVSLYVVDPEGLAGPAARLGVTSGLSRATGGHAFTSTNDLKGAAARIWQEAGGYYLLGVANPPMQRSADLRELEIRALRADVTVRSRRVIPGR